MYCPKCKQKTKVINSRGMENKNGIRRIRECLACDHRFTTYEEYENSQYLMELNRLKDKLHQALSFTKLIQNLFRE